MFSGGYRSGTLVENGLTMKTLKHWINLFYATSLFLYPLKTSGFLFSGGREIQ